MLVAKISSPLKVVVGLVQLLLICNDRQASAQAQTSGYKATLATNQTALIAANDTSGGVDEILRDTFQLLDSLDQKLTQVTNKTRGNGATLRALDEDDLIVEQNGNSQALKQTGPNRGDLVAKSSLVVPNLFSKISAQQHQASGNLRPEEDDQLTQLAERFSSVRKSSAVQDGSQQLVDSLATSASNNREHKVVSQAQLARSPPPSSTTPPPPHKKSARQLNFNEESPAAFGQHANLGGKFDNNFTEKHIRFTLDMMQAIFASHSYTAKSRALESFLISPVSIQLVLMMMHLGARGQTKRELSNSLHFLSASPSTSSSQGYANSSLVSNSSGADSSNGPKSAKLTRRHPQQARPAASTAKPSLTYNQQSTSQPQQQQQALNNNVHEQFGAAMRQLLKDPTVVRALTSANQIFYQRDLPLSAQYEWAVRHYYGTDLKQVDFQNQAEQQVGSRSAAAAAAASSTNSSSSATAGSVQQMINEWVERQTRGKICNFLGSPVPTSTMLMALNVLFYKGDWQYKFDPADTDPEAWFTRSDGHTVKVPMMVSKLPLAHAHDPIMKTSVIELPYKAQRLGLFILLPDEVDGIFETMQQLNSSSLANLISMMRKIVPNDPTQTGGGGGAITNANTATGAGINVRIPKFSIESSPRMSQILSQQLGLKTLFSPDVADLSGMFATSPASIVQKRSTPPALNQSAPSGEQHSAPPPVQVGLDELLHKAVLQVHEQGSIAAAASATIVERVGLFNGQYFEADHPFLIFLMDKQTGLVLFSGVFAGPAAAPSSNNHSSGPDLASNTHHQQASNSSNSPLGHSDASARSPKASA